MQLNGRIDGEICPCHILILCPSLVVVINVMGLSLGLESPIINLQAYLSQTPQPFLSILYLSHKKYFTSCAQIYDLRQTGCQWADPALF